MHLMLQPVIEVAGDATGDYEVEIADQTAEFMVLPAPLAINWGLIIGIIAAVVVIGLAIFLSMRRRRSAQA